GTDLYGRLLALGEALKQQFVVENRPGASGNVGAAAAARAAPDGYTFFVSANPALSVNPSLYKDLPYDAERDFVPVTRGVIAVMVLVVNPSLEAKSLRDLVSAGKSAPKTLAYGAAGSGSPTYLGIQMLSIACTTGRVAITIDLGHRRIRHVPAQFYGLSGGVGLLRRCCPDPRSHRRSAHLHLRRYRPDARRGSGRSH